MSALLETVCPSCGDRRSRLLFKSPDRQLGIAGDFCASRCEGCGLTYQNPRIRPEALARHYPDDYASYAVSEMIVGPSATWHLQYCQSYTGLQFDLDATDREQAQGKAACLFMLIPDYAPDGRLIEIGCAAGNRLALFKRLGWKTPAGIEYSERAAATARSRGFAVTVGPAEEALQRVPDASLDAIVGGFVIEHLPDPFAFTRVVAAKLKRRGQFLFSTVNVATPDFWLYGRYWYDLDLPRHMVLFRERDLIAMLGAEFRVENIRYESSVRDYVESARYRLRDRPAGWRRRLDEAMLKHGPRMGRALSYLARIGLGARVYVSARKR